MRCAHCGHVVDWHGDRAIGGCDGGWNFTNTLHRFSRHGPVAVCSCPGWKAEAS